MIPKDPALAQGSQQLIKLVKQKVFCNGLPVETKRACLVEYTTKLPFRGWKKFIASTRKDQSVGLSETSQGFAYETISTLKI